MDQLALSYAAFSLWCWVIQAVILKALKERGAVPGCLGATNWADAWWRNARWRIGAL